MAIVGGRIRRDRYGHSCGAAAGNRSWCSNAPMRWAAHGATTYPGIACDIPAHLYLFSFRPPADWATLFPRGCGDPRLLAAHRRRGGLTPFIRPGCELVDARWDASSAQWSS